MNTATRANGWLVAAQAIYDPGQRAGAAMSEVAQTYVKLVDCIAIRDECAPLGEGTSRDLRLD
jgi:hypothetical protein